MTCCGISSDATRAAANWRAANGRARCSSRAWRGAGCNGPAAAHRAGDRSRAARWGSVARYGSIAAALVLIVGAAFWFSRPVDAAAFDDSVDDHIACALTIRRRRHYDATRCRADARAEVPADRQCRRRISRADYELVDAHMCPYQGRNYAHLVYRGRRHVLSVFAKRRRAAACRPRMKSLARASLRPECPTDSDRPLWSRKMQRPHLQRWWTSC